MTRSLVRGDLVIPEAVLADGGLLIEDGRIAAVLDAAAATAVSDDVPVDDRRGRLILPGVVDAHVHSFSDPGETFAAATRAAAAGGVTTIVDMPYDEPEPIDDPDRLAAKIARIPAEAVVDVALHGTLRPGTGGAALEAMVEAGACGFKVSMFETDPRRFPRVDAGDLRQILAAGRRAGVTVGVHAEDGEIIGRLVAEARAAGRTAPLDHCLTRPTESETVAVAAAVELALATGARFHLFHASTPETVRILDAAKAAGADVTAETCPHYLVLDDADMAVLGARGKINPPLRSAGQVAGNWDRLADGGYDMVTSDHAPWPIHRKQHPVIFNNASGAPGVQTLAPLILAEGWLGGRLSLLRVAQVLSENPANRFNLGHRKGRLAVGLDADYLVFDPAGRSLITAATQLSRAGWTPYEGRSLPGAIEETVVRGQAVYRSGGIVEGTRPGEFIPGRAA